MAEYNKKSSKISFPFRKQLFIGIIKFYSTEKEFGYIVSNNLGMSDDKSKKGIKGRSCCRRQKAARKGRSCR